MPDTKVPAIDRPCTCDHPDTDIHSGVRECSRCWDLRKLDGPAASHWAKVAALALSNIDWHDAMTWMPDSGLSPQQFGDYLDQNRAILTYADRILHPDSAIDFTDGEVFTTHHLERLRSYLPKRS